MAWTRKDLLGLKELTQEELMIILDQVKAFKEVSTRSVKKVPALRGRTVVLCFLEPSTRTRASFELAAKRLSADILQVQPTSSSLVKGESIVDMARNIEAMKVDVVILRHNSSGIPLKVAQAIGPSVINAGDGSHEHPTQGLIDLFTILEKKGRIKGLKVLIVGDILHSRVARSDLWGLTKLGAQVTFCGPPPLVPRAMEAFGARIEYDLEKGLRDADVAIALRIQKERQQDQFIPSFRDYAQTYGIDRKKLKGAKSDLIIMHPGPVNRGVELAPDVADGPQSVILDQVTNGIAVRMASLFLVVGGQAAQPSSTQPQESPSPVGVDS
jgi:aspartate carbamoyltransferase catalytic subunit